MTLEEERKALEEQRRTLEREKKDATEKERVKKQKDFYQRVSDFSVTAEQPVIRGEMFFSGVESRQSLKKRYKDLIKIYHPDNLDGDKNTVQMAVLCMFNVVPQEDV